MYKRVFKYQRKKRLKQFFKDLIILFVLLVVGLGVIASFI